MLTISTHLFLHIYPSTCLSIHLRYFLSIQYLATSAQIKQLHIHTCFHHFPPDTYSIPCIPMYLPTRHLLSTCIPIFSSVSMDMNKPGLLVSGKIQCCDLQDVSLFSKCMKNRNLRIFQKSFISYRS